MAADSWPHGLVGTVCSGHGQSYDTSTLIGGIPDVCQVMATGEVDI